MPRFNRPTRNPEIVALGVLALRSYAQNRRPETQFEAAISRTLKDLDVLPAVAARLVTNFDRIRPSVRHRVFGPLGSSDAQIPADVARGSRTPNPPDPRQLLRPGVLALTARHTVANGGAPVPVAGDGGPATKPALGGAVGVGAIPAEEQILAPERYSISYQGLHCVDETGVDFLGSDEIYVITSAVHIQPDGTNVVRTERHPLRENGAGTYGDVDSHETRIGPVASCWSALVDDTDQGMSLTTVVMEHDQGDPDAYRDEVDAAVKLAVGLSIYLFPAGGAILALIEASGLITDFFNSLLGTGDDEIGTVTIVLGSLSELENYSRTRLSSFHTVQGGQQINTNLTNHFLAPVSQNDYVVAYRVTRFPKAPVFPPRPID